MDMQSIQNFFSTTVADLAIKVLAAIAFWIVGRWLIGRVIAIMSAAMNRNAHRPDADQVPRLDRQRGAEYRPGAGHPGLLRHPDDLVRGHAGRRRRGHRRGLERHARQFRGRRLHARAAAHQGGRLRAGRRPRRHRARTGPVRHHDHHARQRVHAGRQQQDLRRHDPEFLGPPGAARRAHGTAGRQRGRAGRHRALQGGRGARFPTWPPTRRPRSTCSTSTSSAP